jgi:hypothetical protein
VGALDCAPAGIADDGPGLFFPWSALAGIEAGAIGSDVSGSDGAGLFLIPFGWRIVCRVCGNLLEGAEDGQASIAIGGGKCACD